MKTKTFTITRWTCNLQHVRGLRGFSQTRLARLCDVSVKSIRAIEDGHDMKMGTAYRICKVLGVKFEEIWSNPRIIG